MEIHTVNAIPACITLAFTVLCIFFDCRRDVRRLVTARNAFLLTIIAWFLLEACLLPDAVLRYSAIDNVIGLLAVTACIVCFLLGYSGSRGGVFNGVFARLSRIDNPRVVWGLFLFAVALGILPLLYASNGNVILILEDAFVPKRRWSGMFGRARFGGARDAIMELQLFLRAALPLGAAILVQKEQGSGRKLIVLFFLSFMVMRSINDGTRSKVVEVFLPIAAAVYWRMPNSMKRKMIVFVLPCIIALAFLWSAATVLGRNQGKLDWKGAMTADYIGFEMFRELLFLQDLVPSRSDYQLGHTYFVQLVNPIPRFLWPGKPSGDAGLQLAELQGAVKGGEAIMTVSPGLIGEMHWNAGWPGIILISIFFGYLAKSWDRARIHSGDSILVFTVFAAGLAIIFVSGRSVNMSSAYGMLGLFAILLLFPGGRSRPRAYRPSR